MYSGSSVGMLESSQVNEQEFHQAQDFYHRQASDNSVNAEPNLTLTLIDAEGNGNVQTSLSISDFDDYYYNIANSLNPANNPYMSGSIGYNWGAITGIANPRRAFNGDITTSDFGNNGDGSVGSWRYADIINGGAGPTDSGWIGLDLNAMPSARRKITQYEIHSLIIDEQMAQNTPYANGGSDPKDWTFEGSNDGTNWTVLDTQTNQSFSDASMNGELKRYNFANTTDYRYYRLNVSSNHGANNFGVQELRFNYFPEGTL